MNSPIRMDGADSSTSETKRTALASSEPAAILGEVGADHQPDRRADQRAERGLDQGADDGVQQAAIRSRAAWWCW